MMNTPPLLRLCDVSVHSTYPFCILLVFTFIKLILGQKVSHVLMMLSNTSMHSKVLKKSPELF